MPGFTDNEHLGHPSSLHVLRLVDPFLTSCVPFLSFIFQFVPFDEYFPSSTPFFSSPPFSLSLVLSPSGITTRCTDSKRGTHVGARSYDYERRWSPTGCRCSVVRERDRSTVIFDDQVTSCAVKPANLRPAQLSSGYIEVSRSFASWARRFSPFQLNVLSFRSRRMTSIDDHCSFSRYMQYIRRHDFIREG